jgi:hypothetical protein
VQEQVLRALGARRFFIVGKAVLVVRVGRDSETRDGRLYLIKRMKDLCYTMDGTIKEL